MIIVDSCIIDFIWIVSCTGSNDIILLLMFVAEQNATTVGDLPDCIRYFGPVAEPPTPSHTCWHIPANLTYGRWYKKNISHFRWNLQRFSFSITGAVSVPIYGGFLDLWLQDLWSHYSVELPPYHIQHSWWCHSKIGSELMWCWHHMFTIWQKLCPYLTMFM